MINSTNRFKIKLNTNSQNYTGIVASIPTGGTKLSNFKSAAIYAKVKHSKNQIMQENQGKSGIYLFRNSINGKIYIGSSINLKRRFREYFNINYLQKNNSMAICRALLKYGYSSFSGSFPPTRASPWGKEILEYCEPSELLEREDHLINLLKPEYNIAKYASAPMLGRNHSEQSKAIMGEAHKGKIHAVKTKAPF